MVEERRAAQWEDRAKEPNRVTFGEQERRSNDKEHSLKGMKYSNLQIEVEEEPLLFSPPAPVSEGGLFASYTD
jgi:hypothetical protein